MNPELKNVSAIGRYLFFTPLLFISISLHATIDFGVSEIIAPMGGCGMSESEFVVVEIKNYGNVSVAGFPVSFQVNGGIVYTEMVLLPLAEGDSTINYFGISFDFTTPGLYTIRAWTDGDAHPDNDSTTLIIESLATPVIEFGPDLTICSTQILDAENPGSDYAWSNGETTQTIMVDISGTYSVTITNPETGCTATDDIEITILDLPEATFNYSLADMTCTFTNTSLNCDAYYWDFGDDITSTEENPVHIYTLPGAYNVTLSASNVCTADETIQTVSWPVNILSVAGNTFNISPNPAKKTACFKFANSVNSEMQIRIINYAGEIVYTNKIESNMQTVDLSELSSGLYTVQLSEKNQIIAIAKMAVQK